MDLWAAVLESRGRRDAGPAFVTPDGNWTFDQLLAGADRLAVDLSRSGIRSGDRVGIALPNSPAFLVSLMAVFRLGGVAALISPRYGAGEWRGITSGTGSLSLLTQPEVAARIRQAGIESFSWSALTPSADGPGIALGVGRPSAPENPRGSTEVLLKFTSGSTAAPKGIALCLENVIAEATAVSTSLEISTSTQIYAPVPLCHSYGFDLGVMPFLFHGARLQTEEAFVPRRVLRVLAGGEVDVFLGVPAQYHFLLETAPADPPSLGGIQHALSCTAPLAPRVISDFYDKFGLPICQHYGSSETGGVTSHVPSEVLDRLLSVGRPLPGVEVTIVDEAGSTVPGGVEGEVSVSGAAVSMGYVMGAPEGVTPFRDGRFFMGDRGVLDAGGFLEIRGRRDDLMNVGGLKVSPLEVTRMLEEFPAVREALVYGSPDPAGGHVVEAMVTLKSDATEKEMLAFLQSRLADFKVPRRIHVRDDLPRGATGKPRPPGDRKAGS
jgi:long-chain acyl-CoA synthetase